MVMPPHVGRVMYDGMPDDGAGAGAGAGAPCVPPLASVGVVMSVRLVMVKKSCSCKEKKG